MGFGLLLIGYITVLGVLPESFIYANWGIYIAVAGGFAMLAGFKKLEEFNVYFKLMKYISIIYILMLLGFTPFVIPKYSEEFMVAFAVVSKIIRICFLFVFHFFLLQGILSLAKEINNIIIEKKAKRNIFITYLFFSAFVLEFINTVEIFLIMFIFGFAYFILMISTIYSCYMRITYEGHDEMIEEKYHLKKSKKSKDNKDGENTETKRYNVTKRKSKKKR